MPLSVLSHRPQRSHNAAHDLSRQVGLRSLLACAGLKVSLLGGLLLGLGVGACGGGGGAGGGAGRSSDEALRGASAARAVTLPEGPDPRENLLDAPPVTRAVESAVVPSYALDASGNWALASAPAEGSDAAVLASARRELAEGRAGRAYDEIDRWLSPRERTDHPLLPQAYLLRADAQSGMGDEYQALYDYEAVIKSFPSSPEYVTAVERELDIAVKYVNGTRRKMAGIRWVDASSVGEELLLRVHERLPGSRLAERASIELADFYYRERDLESAAIAYELFQQNHPRSAYTMRARQRQIFSNLGRFKGPRYDSTKLLDSRLLIDRFRRDYPAQAQQLGLDEALGARIDESGAQQMLDAADWHLRRGDGPGARLILNRLVREHPRTATAQRTLALLEQRRWLEPTRAELDAQRPAIPMLPADQVPGAPGASSSGDAP